LVEVNVSVIDSIDFKHINRNEMFPLGAIAAPLLVASAYGQLKIDFATNRHPQQSHVEARLAKRSGSFELTSYRMPHDEVSSTTITTGSIGTPAQNLRFLINPLVGVTSLPAFGSELCKDKVVNCTFGGSCKPSSTIFSKLAAWMLTFLNSQA